MITTRRSDGFLNTENARGGVDVFEKRTYANSEVAPEREESMEEAKARMQRNLDRLLNYDRYSEMEAEEKAAVITDAPVEEKEEVVAYSDEDIRPTTTTTQFIDGDPQIFNDAEKSKEDYKSAYKLNSRGKLVVVLYALVVTVILALIVLNTGVLKSLSKDIATLDATYKAQVSAVAAQQAEIAEISSDAHILNIAENEYGMISR